LKPSTQDNSEKLKRLQLLISLNNDLSETLSKSTIPNTPIVNRIFAVQRTLWLEIGELCEEILPIDDMTKLMIVRGDCASYGGKNL